MTETQAIDNIRELACEAFDYTTGLECNQHHVVLSEALEEAGYPVLAKAVLCGVIWAAQIAEGEELEEIESYAAIDSDDSSWQPYRNSWFRPEFNLSAKRQEVAKRKGVLVR